MTSTLQQSTPATSDGTPAVLPSPAPAMRDGSNQVGCVTVTVSPAPASWGWPVGTLAVISRQGGDARRAIARGAACWTTGASVSRHRAAMALSLATDLRPDMTPIQIAETILAVYDQDSDHGRFVAGESVARAAQRRAELGIRATRSQAQAYRRYWPDRARTRLCLELADRLLASVTGGVA